MNYSIYVESTPNPKVMKFVSNRMLADKSLEFLTVKNARKIPMIYKIFTLPFVESIFLSTNFISITKVDNVDWDDITMELRNFITQILNEDETDSEFAATPRYCSPEIRHGDQGNKASDIWSLGMVLYYLLFYK